MMPCAGEIEAREVPLASLRRDAGAPSRHGSVAEDHSATMPPNFSLGTAITLAERGTPSVCR